MKNDYISILLEYGEADLNKLLANLQKKREDWQKQGWVDPGQAGLVENYIRLYWQQMLEAVHTVHQNRIVHGDLKPANFVSFQVRS